MHRGSKVIEGVSAEEIVAVITSLDCRKTWDERFDSAHVLQSYGGHTRTSFLTAKAGFPFRDRGFYLASVVAREHTPMSTFNRRPARWRSNHPQHATLSFVCPPHSVRNQLKISHRRNTILMGCLLGVYMWMRGYWRPLIRTPRRTMRYHLLDARGLLRWIMQDQFLLRSTRGSTRRSRAVFLRSRRT